MAHPQTLAKFRNLLAKVNLPMSEKAMFGEVTFYCEGKVVGYCCDEFYSDRAGSSRIRGGFYPLIDSGHRMS